MELAESWPRLLQNRLDDNGQRYRVQNSSITGDTTQGGLARLPRLLDKYVPAVVIIELGGNDGLRGLSLDITRSNLAGMIEQSQAIDADVVLTGIILPPNYGAAYTERFQALYADLAAEFDLLLVLVRAKGDVVSRQDLLHQVWNVDADADTNVLDVHIGRLRKKIDRPDRSSPIQTVKGEGYLFDGG